MRAAARLHWLGVAAALCGCGRGRDPAPAATGRYVEHTVHVTGATLDPSYQRPASERTYSVWLPAGYDPTVAHRTVFVVPTDTLFPREGDPDAIYVGLDPPPGNDPAIFDEPDARSPDREYFALVAAKVEQTFSVDRGDELVAGTGPGGALANMLGCYFGKADAGRRFGPELALRAQFFVAGRLPVDLPACAGPIATLWIHDTSEGNLPSEASASIDRLLDQDGCEGTAGSEAWAIPVADEAVGCDRYTGCPAGSPVVFCATTWRGRQMDYTTIAGPLFNRFLGELDAGR